MCSFTPEQRKQLIDIYPYLQPRNVWSDKIPEDYNYEYIRGEHEVPDGWMRLFLLYCKAIRPILVSNNYLNQFRFSQVKEKYGTLRLYNFGYCGGMEDIEFLYTGYSEFVCQRCGKPAKYSTIGWIEQLCAECYDPAEQSAERVVKHRATRVRRYDKNGETIRILPYKDVNREYMSCMKMSDDQFFNYITEERNYAPEKYRETRTQES